MPPLVARLPFFVAFLFLAPRRSPGRSVVETLALLFTSSLPSAMPPDVTTVPQQNLLFEVDGACPNNGKGSSISSIGVHVQSDRSSNISQCLSDEKHTNQRAELSAGIAALEEAFVLVYTSTLTFISELPATVTIQGDSEHLVKGMNEWMPNWKQNGYQTAKKKAVSNKDLWLRLDELVNILALGGIRVDFRHVKRDLNERANALAQKALEHYPNEHPKFCKGAWHYSISGAYHKCKYRESFKSYRPIWPLPVDGPLGSSHIWAIGIGDVHLNLRLSNGKQRPAILKNVLHVPSLLVNIFCAAAAASQRDFNASFRD